MLLDELKNELIDMALSMYNDAATEEVFELCFDDRFELNDEEFFNRCFNDAWQAVQALSSDYTTDTMYCRYETYGVTPYNEYEAEEIAEEWLEDHFESIIASSDCKYIFGSYVAELIDNYQEEVEEMKNKYDTSIYEEWHEEKRAKMNEFPLYFAFSKEQLEEVFEKTGGKDNTICVADNGFIARENLEAWHKLAEELNEDFFATYKDDPEALKGAYWYELGNHEAQYNYQIEFDLANCFGKTEEEIANDPNFKEVYNHYMDCANEFNWY